MTKPLTLIPIYSNNNINVINDDVINSNEISTYDQAYDSNGELKKMSMVITIYFMSEINVSIRKLITK